MSSWRRSLGALAMATGLTGAMLAAATPAQAAGLTADMFCEPIRYSLFCEAWHSGAVGPVTIKWSYNGYYFPQHDNKTYVSFGCSANTSPRVSIVVTDSTGATVTDSTTRRCTGGAP